MVINKIDTLPHEEILAIIAAYAEKHDFDAIIPVSAKTGKGTDILMNELYKFALDGPALFQKIWCLTNLKECLQPR